jgi:hypothetical protein
MDSKRLTRANPAWKVVYPSSYHTDPSTPCSIIFVNNRLNSNHWKQIPVPSNDITAIQFTGPSGTLAIFNIYNACEHTRTLRFLERTVAKDIKTILPTVNDHMIWFGDFNRHHPFWDEERNSQLFTKPALAKAEILIQMVADFHMSMALPRGIPTLRQKNGGNWTRPDNVWCTENKCWDLSCGLATVRLLSNSLCVYNPPPYRVAGISFVLSTRKDLLVDSNSISRFLSFSHYETGLWNIPLVHRFTTKV